MGDKVGRDKVQGDVVGGNKGDIYVVKDSIGVGRDVKMKDVDITQQINRTNDSIDLLALSDQLSTLRAQLKDEATEPEHDIAIGAVASAESAAKSGDESQVFAYLSKAGQWALDVASKIGVSVASEAIKKAMSG